MMTKQIQYNAHSCCMI